MKIAVPVTNNNQIDEHFGHCSSYNVYTILPNGEINGLEKMASPQGCGCKSNIAGVMAANGVSIMLAGGIGGGAINVLNAAGIEVVRGCTGDATEMVRLFVAGNVSDSGSSCQQHGHDHVCEH
jgi:predicted Fe-Mo cluster-binding NifX family protein